MKKKINYNEAIRAYEGLAELIKTNLVLDSKMMLKIFRNKQNLEGSYQSIMSVKEALLKRYGKEDSTGMLHIDASDPKWGEWLKEFTKSTEEEVEVEFEQIPLEALNGVGLSAIDKLVGTIVTLDPLENTDGKVETEGGAPK